MRVFKFYFIGILFVSLLFSCEFLTKLEEDSRSREQDLVSGYYKISVKHSGKYLDVSGASKNDGANIIQWPYHGRDNQQFKFVDAGGGYYNIIAKHSGKCLDVYGASQSDGKNIIQWACHGRDNQKFRLDDVGGGYYNIIAKHSGKCIDVAGVSQNNGANLHQWSCWGGDNQKFSIPEFIKYDFSNADRIFKDGTSVAQLTSESDRLFRMDQLIRMRPVNNTTLEIVNFIPVDLQDVEITLSINGGPSNVQLMRISHLPAHAITHVQYPFIRYTGANFFNTQGLPVDMSAYRGGVSANAVTFDFRGNDPVLRSLERVRSSVHWTMKIHDFDVNNSQDDNWEEDPSPRHARLYTQHMINIAYIWTDPSMQQRLADTRIIDNDGSVMSTQEKLDALVRLLNFSRLNLGVVVNFSGLGGGSTFGVAQYILEHDFLYGSQDGCNFHEMGHCIGYGHSSTMTYPDSNGVGFSTMCQKLANELFNSGKLVITQGNYYKREDHQVRCNSNADCPGYMECTGTTYSDGSYKYCE